MRPHSREMDCQLGYVECDDFGRNILRCDLIHGDGVSNWTTSRVTTLSEHSEVRPRSREMECQIGIRREDEFGRTFFDATSRGDGVSIGIRRVDDFVPNILGSTLIGDGISNWDTSNVMRLTETFGSGCVAFHRPLALERFNVLEFGR